jgi:prepilin signal peptidase PulO-like enzyme (type II secretory pathway)
MEILLGSYLFLLGLIFGSFALVLTDRVKQKRDWVHGRSSCEFCKHTLSARDLVPLFSWLSTSGKCRYCKRRLSAAYPLTELGLGLAFVGSYAWWPFEFNTVGLVLFVLWLLGLVICCAMFVYDLRWYILPNKFVYPLAVVAGLHRCIIIFTNDVTISKDLLSLALSLLVSAGFFFVLHEYSKGKWIGDGDVRLGVAMGLFLPGPLEAWLAICIASLAGVVIATPKLVQSHKNLKMKLPFGPLLLLGLFASYLFAESVLHWYTTTFLYL